MGCNPLALEKRFYLTISCKLYMLSQGAPKGGSWITFVRFPFCVFLGGLGVNIVVVTEQ